jgi:hypothetical protein
VSPLWSYGLAAVGVTGLFVAATHPRIGWWLNIAAQVAWVAYAITTRQWGFLASAMAYAVAYIRLLRKAHAPRAKRPKLTPDEAYARQMGRINY